MKKKYCYSNATFRAQICTVLRSATGLKRPRGSWHSTDTLIEGPSIRSSFESGG
jgi:hypothetical protein